MSNKIKYFYEFENFRLDAANPSLWRGNEFVSISPKALEVLILLVEKNGEIVSREYLLESVWKNTFVEEGNINYTISLLRKTLGHKDLIQTVSRHGYRFVADVKKVSENGKSENIQAEIVSSNPIKTKRPIFLFSILIISFLFLTSFTLYSWQSKSNPTPNPPNRSEAMQAYTRGKMILDDRDTKNRSEKAMDEFQNAVTLDPTLALAHVGLAQSFFSAAVESSGAKSAEFYAKSKVSIKKTLELDENLPEAYLVRGMIKRNFDWDLPGAENDFKQVIMLNPDNAMAYLRLAQTLAPLGRTAEALAAMEKAYQIDSGSENIVFGRFSILETAGKYDEGLKLALEALQNNKANIFAIRLTATFEYHKKEYAKVIEICEGFFAANPTRKPYSLLSLAIAAYQKTGQTDKSDAMLQELEIQSLSDTKSLFSLAVNYAELGRIDESITALQKCFEAREERMIWLNVEPRFANLKKDARFLELVKKMNLLPK